MMNYAIEFFCDICTELIPRDAQRFHCSECPDYDVCAKCASEKDGMKCSYNKELEVEANENNNNDNDSSSTTAKKQVDQYLLHPPLYLEKGERQELAAKVVETAVAKGMGHGLLKCFENFAHRPMIGTRHVVANNQKSNKKVVFFKYSSYQEIRNQVLPISYQIVKKIIPESNYNASSQQKEKYPPRCAMMLENCVEWWVYDLACAVSGALIVPIDAVASLIVLTDILVKTEPILLFLHRSRLDELLKLFSETENEKLKQAGKNITLIVSDADMIREGGDDSYSSSEENNNNNNADNSSSATSTSNNNDNKKQIVKHIYQSLSEFSSLSSSPTPDEIFDQRESLFPTRRENEVYTLLFTSGSSGIPKGSIVSHGAFISGTFAIPDKREAVIALYRPASYATDRDNFYRFIGNGGRCALLCSNALCPPVERWLFHEIQIAAPVSFSAPPRIFNMLYDEFQQEMKVATKEDEAESLAAEKEKEKQKQEEKEKQEQVEDSTTANATATTSDSKKNNNNIAHDKNSWENWISLPTTRTARKDAVWKKYREIFGKRLTSITIGSAPPRSEVLSWLYECYQLRGKIVVFHSAGSTESGGFLVSRCDSSGSNWMAPSFGATVTLIPVEDAEDDETNNELTRRTSSYHPTTTTTTTSNSDSSNENSSSSSRKMKQNEFLQKGEMIVQTNQGIQGYFGDEEATSKLFHIDPETGEKWYKTGDLCEFDMRTGLYRIIGRCNVATKLQNGVYFSPEPVEVALSKCECVREICCFANVGFERPVAVVSLQEREISSTTTEKQICQRLREFGAHENVPVTLLPCAVIISKKPFSRVDGTLTISDKISRPGIKKKFGKQLEEAYSKYELERQQAKANSAAAAAISGEIFGENEGEGEGKELRYLVIVTFQQTLGVPISTSELESGCSAVSLGADSLVVGVLREKIFSLSGVLIPLRDFGVMSIADIISRVCHPTTFSHTPSSSLFHGNTTGATNNANAGDSSNNNAQLQTLRKLIHEDIEEIRSFNNNKNKQISSSQQQQEKQQEKEKRGNHYFVTGASGFIGIHVVEEILQRLQNKKKKKQQEQEKSSSSSSSEQKIYLLVRGKDLVAARQKVLATAVKFKCTLIASELLLSLSEEDSKIQILLGDLASENIFTAENNNSTASLFNSIGTIVLVGANVNHYLPYSSLRDSNVKSTTKILKLFSSTSTSTSILHEPPHVIYCSSVSVAPLLLVHDKKSKNIFSAAAAAAAENMNDNSEMMYSREESITGMISQYSTFDSFLANNTTAAAAYQNITKTDFAGRVPDTTNVYLPGSRGEKQQQQQEEESQEEGVVASMVNSFLSVLGGGRAFLSNAAANGNEEEEESPQTTKSSASAATSTSNNQQQQQEGNNKKKSNKIRLRHIKAQKVKKFDLLSDSELLAASNSGYVLSKYVSELLLEEAVSGGILASSSSRVVRIGMTGYNSKTCVGNVSDWLTTLSYAVALVKEIPFSSFPMKLTPVDCLANGIVDLAFFASSKNVPTEKENEKGEGRTPPKATLLDDAIRLDFVQDVWNKYAVTSIPPITWNNFIQKLSEKSLSTSTTETTETEKETAKKVAQRCELLFSTSVAPRGDNMSNEELMRWKEEHELSLEDGNDDVINGAGFAHWILETI